MTHPLQPDPALGVFATMLVVDGVPLQLGAHVERLHGSLRAVYDMELADDDAAALARERARGLALGRLRLSATPEGALDAVGVPVERAIVLPGWERALDLRTAEVAGWRGAHKWADRRLLGQLDAETAPAGALLVDRDSGEVLETTRANVFAVDAHGVLRTPPADGRILPGVTRAHVIALARELGVEVREELLRPEDLLTAREAFTTGSVRGVEPVRSLDGAPIAGPGEVTLALARELGGRWLGDAS